MKRLLMILVVLAMVSGLMLVPAMVSADPGNGNGAEVWNFGQCVKEDGAQFTREGGYGPGTIVNNGHHDNLNIPPGLQDRITTWEACLGAYPVP